uniref:Uncharacterized protein n=1 Tax=Romanomermis culicivorax TaxID=13658 RepID=A0A915HVG9_ROMCU
MNHTKLKYLLRKQSFMSNTVPTIMILPLSNWKNQYSSMNIYDRLLCPNSL